MNARPANRYAQHSSSPMAMSEGPGRSSARPASTSASGPSFAQDFNLEHSRSGAASSNRAVSAQASSSQTTQRRTRNAHDSASPNCIYLG
jgi:hypothetical protein